MKKGLFASISLLLLCSLSNAAQTKITNITKTTLANGDIRVDVEGTNELFNGEIHGSWYPTFQHPNSTIIQAGIVSFNVPTANAGPKTFKFTTTIANPNGNAGTWWAISEERSMPTGTATSSRQFTIP